MNNLSRIRIQELSLLYNVLATVIEEAGDQWLSLSQKDVFDLVTSSCKKKINPSLVQREIERMEQFQLPRNVDDQHESWGGDLV